MVFGLRGVCMHLGDWSTSAGTDYVVSHFGGPAGAAVGQLQPLGLSSSTTRGTAGTALAGHLTGATAIVPGVPAGGLMLGRTGRHQVSTLEFRI